MGIVEVKLDAYVTLILGTRLVVSFTFRPLYPHSEIIPVATKYGGG
jgi:hypothetical protein